jgi:hypothetical protein
MNHFKKKIIQNQTVKNDYALFICDFCNLVKILIKISKSLIVYLNILIISMIYENPFLLNLLNQKIVVLNL